MCLHSTVGLELQLSELVNSTVYAKNSSIRSNDFDHLITIGIKFAKLIDQLIDFGEVKLPNRFHH